MSIYKPCRVHWRDTCHVEGWHSAAALEALYIELPPLMQSLGWLVYQDDNQVVLAQSVGEKAAADLLKIPRSLIVDMFIEKGEADVPMGG